MKTILIHSTMTGDNYYYVVWDGSNVTPRDVRERFLTILESTYDGREMPLYAVPAFYSWLNEKGITEYTDDDAPTDPVTGRVLLSIDAVFSWRF